YFGPTYFYVTDHLGSTRLLTGYPTPSVVECDDYYPFGEQISCGGTSTTTHKFTGYERDTESGLDNAQARYNSSSLGRFMSPDPVGNFVADAANPQTWNLYTYVNNNPLTFIDPTGMYCETSDEFDLSGINDADVCVVFGGVWIDGAHWDNNGNFVGGYDGEVFCGATGGCLVWNAGSQEWGPFGTDTSGPGDPGNGAGPGGANGGCQLSDPMCAILYQSNLTRLNAIQALQQQANRCGQYQVLCNGGNMASAGANAAIAATAPATIVGAYIVAVPVAGAAAERGREYVVSHPGQVVDFMRGFLSAKSSVPPPSDAGMAGWAVGKVVSGIVNSSH
ncbi:MAG TPA: RHS repeat-associated core domain-containing protein, partial [Candidatus Acidoferrales bacterium]|nr:RHS repeat-associated core domain-containing protein [Candidatus Acidoferrales bacterium]